MEIALEILKYILPAAIMFIGTYFIIQNFLESEHRKIEFNYRNDNKKFISPIRLQAYERMITYMERINLSNLVMRCYKNNMNAKQLQLAMLTAIRTEYDHNISQQLYIAGNTWKLIKSAREETVKVINSCSDQLKDNASGVELSQFILELVGKIERQPSDVAIEALVKEVNRSF